ncbi:MAG TPA: Crp/Fnr family transcriptional regulator, partial [Spirochaetota bacterium]
GLSFRDEISSLLNLPISSSDAIMILGVFPISVSVILIIIDGVNPEFFTKNEMKIPVITDAEIITPTRDGDTIVTYSISHSSCFLKTYEPVGIGKKISLTFTYGKQNSGDVSAEVIWENHLNRQYPFGSIVKITQQSHTFGRYISRYRIFKIWKGIIFNLRLPGFESSRRLFLRPLTAMQEDKIFTAGSSVFKEGDDAKQFYLLKKGRITIRKCKGDEEIILGSVDQGQLFGEMAVIPGRKRGSSALCETDSIIAVSDRSNLSELIRFNPDFALSMIQMLAERTEASETILLEYIALLERDGEIEKNSKLFYKKN